MTVGHKTQIATAAGPAERIFKVGEIVDLPELSARLAVMAGKAVLVDGGKSTDAPDADAKPKARATRGKKSTDAPDAEPATPETTTEALAGTSEQPAGE
ncbi:MAG: hypothetical protein KGL39_23010 [Patescibacteria group bacterium]|nr:hypothetical protein [Patescibacteria group bacterium]